MYASKRNFPVGSIITDIYKVNRLGVKTCAKNTEQI